MCILEVLFPFSWRRHVKEAKPQNWPMFGSYYFIKDSESHERGRKPVKVTQSRRQTFYLQNNWEKVAPLLLTYFSLVRSTSGLNSNQQTFCLFLILVLCLTADLRPSVPFTHHPALPGGFQCILSPKGNSTLSSFPLYYPGEVHLQRFIRFKGI